jgi:transcriptional regulator NrdR family protein
MQVIKRNGTFQEFNPNKIKIAIQKALWKKFLTSGLL